MSVILSGLSGKKKKSFKLFFILPGITRKTKNATVGCASFGALNSDGILLNGLQLNKMPPDSKNRMKIRSGLELSLFLYFKTCPRLFPYCKRQEKNGFKTDRSTERQTLPVASIQHLPHQTH
jgi:hypothetical protein